MAKEIATKTKLDTRIAADIAAAMPVASKPVAAKAAAAPALAKKVIVIESEEVQAAVEQTVEGSADVIVAQAASAAASSGAAAGGAAAGMSTTALVVAGVAVAAAASSSSSSSSPAPAPAATTPTTTTTPVAGQTFTLSTGIDAVTGTAGNDTFIGSFDGAATSTSNLGDTVDGGAGTDTVRITSNAAATLVPTLTNVENLVIIDSVHESRDVSLIAGLTSLELSGGTTIDGATVTATLAAGQTLKLTGVTDADTAAATVADGGISIATGAAVNSVALTLAGAGTTAGVTATANNSLVVGVAGTGVTTLDITATGTNNVNLLNAGAALTTVNINSSGATTFWGTNAATITTVNASASTGAVTFDASASTGADQTITGGSGNDTLTADLAVNLALNAGAGNDVVVLANPTAANLSSVTGAADAINGGEGTDTLSLTAAGAAALAGDAAADRAVITNFERVRVTSDLTGNGFAISGLGVNYLEVGADITTAAVAVTGFTSGATVAFRDANATAATQFALNVTMTGATNAGTNDDLLNLVLNDNLVNQTTAGAADTESIQIEVGISGINKLTVSTADRDNADAATTRDDGYTLTLSNDNSLSLLTVSGTNELSFTSTATTASLTTIDASTLTGDLIVNLSTNGLTQGVTITGGAGVNTITGTGFGDTITGGARADTLTLGGGADTVTGRGGADTFVVVAADYTAATAAALAAAADSITDFARNSDIIDWDATISFVTNATATTGTAAINAEGIASFAAADDTLAERITAVEAAIVAGGAATDGQAAIFEFNGDTYVFISEGTDGVGAGDALIKLVGVTGLTDSTINGGNNLLIA